MALCRCNIIGIMIRLCHSHSLVPKWPIIVTALNSITSWKNASFHFKVVPQRAHHPIHPMFYHARYLWLVSGHKQIIKVMHLLSSTFTVKCQTMKVTHCLTVRHQGKIFPKMQQSSLGPMLYKQMHWKSHMTLMIISGYFPFHIQMFVIYCSTIEGYKAVCRT